MNFGFIILRHVRDEVTNSYWQHCLESLRNVYPDNPVMIIDDNSNQKFVTECTDINCKIITSEFPGCGEILPYYYMWKLRPFNRAVFIHDSVFIKKKFELEEAPIQFVWSFTPLRNNGDIHNYIMYNSLFLYKQLNHGEFLASYFRSNSNWLGCFGAMSNFTFDEVDSWHQKYNIFNLLSYITNRDMRMAWERVIAVVSYNNRFNYKCDGKFQQIPKAINGSIFDYRFHYKYSEYLVDKNTENSWWIDKSMVKVWSGR